MNSYNLFLIILISSILTGCEDSPVNDNVGVEQKKETLKKTESDKEKVDVIKPEIKPVIGKKVEKKISKQAVKVKAKTKPNKAKAKQEGHIDREEQITEQTEQTEDQFKQQPVLDLKIPFEIKQNKQADNTSSAKKQQYLPDLFADKKSKKRYPLHVDGKIIETLEQEEGKDTAVDGVGLDFKLNP